MLFNKEREIQLFGRQLGEVVDELFEALPTLDTLRTASLRLSIDEEFALDTLQGMFWPLIFTRGLAERYEKAGMARPEIMGIVGFPNDALIELTSSLDDESVKAA